MKKLLKKLKELLKRLFKGHDDGAESAELDCGSCQSKAACQTVDPQRKYAVVVGLEWSQWGDCAGADKDSDAMAKLISPYVPTSHVVRLNDSKAKRSAVMKALSSQIAKVPEDGLFIFTYSGHGGQTDYLGSKAKDDADGRDEFLCLYDGQLLDDELWEIFSRCKGRLFVVFDCCHSGTMYRLSPDGQQKDDVVDFDPIQVPFMKRLVKSSRRQRRDGSAPRMLVFSGCGEETVSWGDAANGGVMTCALKKHFSKCISYRSWWNLVKADSSFSTVR